MAIKLDPLQRGVILTDFPLNPSANLRLRARRDFFRDSACFVFSFVFFNSQERRPLGPMRIIIMEFLNILRADGRARKQIYL